MSITQQQARALEALDRVYYATHASFIDRNLVRQYIEQGAGAAPEDNIAKAKRIMNAVDDYADNPTNDTRHTLRSVILDQLVAAVAPLLTHKAEDAPSDAELLDSRGKIRSDLKSSAYCVGNEYKPFHPSASHVRPEWRDGWNACYVAAIRAAIAQERKA